MSAPGNSAVLVTLLAALIICTGYAAGRLHQWYRAAADREEAYQEGYDSGTRSTFSMAARIAGPRRDKAAVRASAAVRSSSSESPATCSSPPAAQPFPPKAVPSPVPGPPDPSPSASPSAPSLRPAAASALPPTPPPAVSSASPSGLPHASAFAPFIASSPSGSVDPAGIPSASPASVRDDVSSSGRHFVPDELVRAATYRLAPDRVARAKVRGAVPPDDTAEAPGRPPVPKPRAS